MFKFMTTALMVAIVSFQCSAHALGQPGTAGAINEVSSSSPWIGKRIVIKPGFVLRVEDDPVEEGGVHRVYTVESVVINEKTWLRASYRDVRGFIEVDNVVALEKAVSYYSDLITKDAGNVEAIINRGLIWEDKEEPDLALADYSVAIRLNPRNEIAYYLRGNLWKKKKDYDRAIKDYDQAIQINNSYTRALLKRGLTRQMMLDFDKAMEDFASASKLDRNSPEPYNCRAWLLATFPIGNKRDGRKAVEEATHACVLSKWNNADCLDTLAAAYAEDGDFEAAVKWSNEALKRTPKDDPRRVSFEAHLSLFKAGKAVRLDSESP